MVLWSWKIIVIALFAIQLPYVTSDDSGPFDELHLSSELPLAHKLKGLDYELQNGREEEVGIKEEVLRQQKNFAELTHSVVNEEKVAHIPSIEDLLADLPVPLLKSVQKLSQEKLKKTQISSKELNSATTHSPKSLPESSLLETAPSSLLQSDFPSQVPPPPLDEPSTSVSDSGNELHNAQNLGVRAPSGDFNVPTEFRPSSSAFLGGISTSNSLPSSPTINFHSTPFDQDLSLSSRSSSRKQPRQSSMSHPYNSNVYSPHPLPRSGPMARVPQRLRSQYRSSPSRARSLDPLEPSANYEEAVGYPRVLDGVPLQMQPQPLSQSGILLQEKTNVYTPQESVDPLHSIFTERDVIYSRRHRANAHLEPPLPDLPSPPVVAPV